MYLLSALFTHDRYHRILRSSCNVPVCLCSSNDSFIVGKAVVMAFEKLLSPNYSLNLFFQFTPLLRIIIYYATYFLFYTLYTFKSVTSHLILPLNWLAKMHRLHFGKRWGTWWRCYPTFALHNASKNNCQIGTLKYP